MSDTFNSSANKQKIMKALGFESSKDDFIENKVFPKKFRLPEDYHKTKSAQEIVELLLEHKLTILTPTPIRSLTNVEVNFISPNWKPITHGKAYGLPLGDTTFLPHYRAVYFTAPYDTPGLRQLLYQFVNPASEDEQQTEIVKSIFQAAGDLVFTNGTLEGQLKRLEAMGKIAAREGLPDSASRDLLTIAFDYFKPNDPTEGRYDPYYDTSPYEIIARILDDYLPIYGTEAYLDGSFPGLYNAPSWFASAIKGHTFDYLPKIGLDKAAGFPFMGKKKGDVLVESIACADIVVNQTSKALSLGQSPTTNNIDLSTSSGTPAITALKKLYQDFFWLGMGFAFPKAERYKRSEVLTKTRNIYPYPFAAHILSGLISSPAMAGCVNVLEYPTKSLYAFSPFHGGMDKLMNEIYGKMEDREPCITYVYADNWYAILLEGDQYVYYSIDFEKAEAQHQRMDVRAMMYYLLTRGHQKDNRTAFNLTWAHIAMNLIPSISVDNTIVFGNTQVIWPGLASGVTLTFNINHMRSSIWDVIFCRQYKKDRGVVPSNDPNSSFQKFARSFGFLMKVEREIKDFKRVMEDNMAQTPSDVNQYKQIDLDLLGWSALYHPVMEKFIPVLDTDRFTASIACPKNDPDTPKYKDEPWRGHCYTVARWTAIQMVGGWNQPAINRTANNLINAAKQKLIKASQFHEVGDLTLDNTEFADFINIKENMTTYTFDYSQLVKINESKPTNPNTAAQIDRLKAFKANRDKIKTTVDFLSALAIMRADHYLLARDMPRLGDAVSAAVKKTPFWIDAVSEFESIRAVLSKYQPLVKSPANWRKIDRRDPKAISNPFASLYKGVSWKPSNLPLPEKADVGPTTKTKPSTTQQPAASLENPLATRSLLPGASLPSGPRVVDIPKPKAQPEVPVASKTQEKHLPAMDGHAQPESMAGPTSKATSSKLKQAVQALLTRAVLLPVDDLRMELEIIKMLIPPEDKMGHKLWLSLAQLAFKYKGKDMNTVQDLIRSIPHKDE